MAGGSKTTQQLGKLILPFIQALAKNQTITEIDLSGHLSGNSGAIALAKTLQVAILITHSLAYLRSSTPCSQLYFGMIISQD